MSTYVDLDSTYRKLDIYSNPANYVVESDQVSVWSKAPRQVTSNSTFQKVKTLEFAESVKIKICTLPYVSFTYTKRDGTVVTSHTGDLQRIYTDIHSTKYSDMRLINTIGGVISKSRFVLTRDEIQNDSNGDPKWVQFSCTMDQVVRFSRNDPIIVEFMQEEGYTIVITDSSPITKGLQTYVLLELTPYMIDGSFTNNDISLTQF